MDYLDVVQVQGRDYILAEAEDQGQSSYLLTLVHLWALILDKEALVSSYSDGKFNFLNLFMIRCLVCSLTVIIDKFYCWVRSRFCPSSKLSSSSMRVV